MKFFYLLHNFFKKIRFPSIVLAIMMSFSILMGTMTVSRIRSVTYNYNVIKNTSPQLFLAEVFLSSDDYKSPGISGQKTKKLIDSLESLPAVNYAYTICIANPVSFNGKGTSIVLIDPHMLTDFPALENMGLDYSACENGCILAGNAFDSVSGDTIELEFYNPDNHTESFTVCGHMSYPAKMINLSHSKTAATTADDILIDTNSVIMQATDEVLDRLSQISQITFENNCIFSLDSNASEEEIERITEFTDNYGKAVQFSVIEQNTRHDLTTRMKELLPRPMFLLLASIIAYLSMTILLFKRKEKELSICYLCGFGTAKCAVLSVAAAVVISAVPTLANMIFILVFYCLSRKGMISSEGFYISGSSLLPVALYFVLTVIVSAVAVVISMRHKTPASYIRSVSE
ncbi:MAG: hypothetical protein ACI4EU_02730 [Butyrivibrio sp.]